MIRVRDTQDRGLSGTRMRVRGGVEDDASRGIRGMTGTATWEGAVRSLIDDPSQAELVRACYFDPPIEEAAMRFRSSAEWTAVRAVICPPDGRALDVGAGNGIVSYALAADGWDAVALEPDRSELVGSGAIRRLATQLRTPIEVIEDVGEAIPAPSGSFDLVVARQVLHHADDLAAFCGEIARVLKPGGLLLAYRDHVVDGPAHLAAFLEQHPLHRLYGGEHAYADSVYHEALSSAGLVVERRWRHFEAAFNYAPKTAGDVVEEATSRALPKRVARLVGQVCGSDRVYPMIGRALSAVDRRPGRSIAYLARRPVWHPAHS